MKIPLVDLRANYDSIKEEIDSAIQDILDNSSFIMGPHVKTFEESYAKLTESKHCIATSCGTSALMLALKACGVGEGDEVITVSHTFIATAEAISALGAVPVFVDIDNTLLMDPELIEKAITPKTKVIVPVHLYGQMADMERIKKIADAHNIKIIEDAAQAHLSRFKDKQPGHLSDAACYSFFPAKNLGCYGDGGCVTTNDSSIAESISMIRDHGRTNKYEHDLIGFNFRMDALQAAVLQVKLKYISQWIEQRADHAALYSKLLKDLSTPYRDKDRRISHYFYVILTEKRKKIMQHLKKEDIGCGIHFPIPLHLQPAYKSLGYKQGDFPLTEKAADEVLSLPLYPEMTDDQIETVCTEVLNAIQQ